MITSKSKLRIIDRIIAIVLVCLFGLEYVANGQIMLEAKDNTTIKDVFYCNGMLGCKVQLQYNGTCYLALRDMANNNAYIDNATGLNINPGWNHGYQFNPSGLEAYYLYDSVNKIISCSTEQPTCISISSNTNGNVYCNSSTTLTATNLGFDGENIICYWKKNGDIIDSNSSSISIDDVGTYRVEVYNKTSDTDSILLRAEKIIVLEENPEIKFDYSSLIKKKLDGASSVSTFENIYLDKSCIDVEESDFDIDLISGGDDFSLDGNSLILSTNTLGDNYEAQIRVSYGEYSKTVTVKGRVLDYPKCYNVDRYVDNEFYDTYFLCTDGDGNINISLNDENDDFVFISREDFNARKGSNPNNTISVNNGAKVFCGNVRYEFKNDIVCEDFNFDGSHVKDNQYASFDFVFDAKLACNNMHVTQNEDQKRNYFRYTCSSEINAKESIYVDSYNYDAMIVYGKMQGQNVTIKNGNNTSIRVHDCALVRANHLTMIQSGQNNVLIEGHIIADNVEAEAKLQLVYDGTKQNKAIVTIGELNSNTDIVCGENTVVNLCENPVKGSPDNIGFFNGTVIYNRNELNGWYGNVNPLNEGDINEGDQLYQHSSAYWTYFNDGGTYNTKNFDDLLLIPGYANYEDCINEKDMYTFLMPISLEYFIITNDSFIWHTASETNNNYFVVEYSKNGKDWTECTDYIYSASSNGWTYTADPIIDIKSSVFSYFRLKQVDYDGEHSYSNIISKSFRIDNPCAEEFEGERVYINDIVFRLVQGELIYCENDN